MEFKNHQNFMSGLEGVLNSLKGSELSLRLEAASVLKRLLKTKAAKGPIGQVVPQLLEGTAGLKKRSQIRNAY